jgi:hypothetical protein
MKAGQLVELREPGEILATLDARGRLDGLPFMPEMLEFFGRQFAVRARAERLCDTITYHNMRRIPDAVLLDEPRCSGSAHGGCGAGCLIYWKEAWLRPATGAPPPAPAPDDAALAALRQRVQTGVRPETTEHEGEVFSCQATEFPRATQRIRRRPSLGPHDWRFSVRSLTDELRNGNVSPGRFARVMLRIVYEAIGVWTHLRFARPFKTTGGSQPPVFDLRGLQPGDLVQVKSKHEIRATLDERGKYRGLWFDREMVPYCGRTARVRSKVDCYIDEGTGRLVELKSDLYILDGVTCSGDLSVERRFCARAIYPWWREGWLERVEGAASRADAGAPEA